MCWRSACSHRGQVAYRVFWVTGDVRAVTAFIACIFHFAFTNWICDQIPERLTAKVKRSTKTAMWLIRDSFICVLCLKSQSCSNQSLMCFSCCSQCEHRIKGLHWGSEELLTVGSSFRYCLCACFTCLDDYYTVWCLVSFQGIEIWLYLIVFHSLFVCLFLCLLIWIILTGMWKYLCLVFLGFTISVSCADRLRWKGQSSRDRWLREMKVRSPKLSTVL